MCIRDRTNTKLKVLYSAPAIVTEIKMCRLRCLGHVGRMENQQVPKRSDEHEARWDLFCRTPGAAMAGRLIGIGRHQETNGGEK